MGITSAAPTDPQDQHQQNIPAIKRRIGDLERAITRLASIAGLAVVAEGPAWVNWGTANGDATDPATAIVSTGAGNWGVTPAFDARIRRTTTNVQAKLRIASGASAGMNPGTMELSVPRQCRYVAGAPATLGYGWYLNAAGTAYMTFTVVASAATKARFKYATTYGGTFADVTAALPFAFGVGVTMAVDLNYEPA